MDLSTAYRYNQNMMEYYTCKEKCPKIGKPLLFFEFNENYEDLIIYKQRPQQIFKTLI